MKWKNTCFAFKEIAELCKAELDKARVKTGDIFTDIDGCRVRYYLPWMAIGKEQYEIALTIVCKHIE